jgi:hypothetical protein
MHSMLHGCMYAMYMPACGLRSLLPVGWCLTMVFAALQPFLAASPVPGSGGSQQQEAIPEELQKDLDSVLERLSSLRNLQREWGLSWDVPCWPSVCSTRRL